MSVRLLMSSYSICNTTISCDSLGIHYEVSRKDGVRSVKRWDSSTNTNITVGEIQFRLIITKSLIKLGPTMVQEGEWRNVNDVFVKCRMLSDSRTFEGKDGRRYKWNLTWKGPVMVPDDGEKHSEPLVTYHPRILRKELGYLEIHDSSVIGDLDYIIVTFLFMEKRRRDK